VGRQQSRRVLLAGLAGAGVRTGGALLYDAERVATVAGWPAVEHTVLLAESPCGVFVARLGPGREVSALAGWEESAAAVRVQADLGFPAWAQAKALLGVGGRLPFVASVCGFPVLLAAVASGVTSGSGSSPPGRGGTSSTSGAWSRRRGRRGSSSATSPTSVAPSAHGTVASPSARRASPAGPAGPDLGRDRWA
jgi:hypothetical protein